MHPSLQAGRAEGLGNGCRMCVETGRLGFLGLVARFHLHSALRLSRRTCARQGFRSNDELKKIFQEYGPITDAHIPTNRATGVAKGFGFVEFKRSSHADACVPNRVLDISVIVPGIVIMWFQ